MLEKIIEQAQATRAVADVLANLSTQKKNALLLAMADKLAASCDYILQENQKDLATAQAKGISIAMLDRLRLTAERIDAMAAGVRQVATLNDPIGEILSGQSLPNGLVIKKIRVPLGVIGMIYESRPNVTVDAIALCIKSGNAVILRGGSEAINSNLAIVNSMLTCLTECGLPRALVNFIDNTDRQAVNTMLKLNKYIDVIIPRGGAGLIQTVIQNSTIPVIETGVGVCHVYVDESADIEMATKIVINAKVSRPAVCNSAETLLVHRNIAERFLPNMLTELQNRNVLVQGCEQTAGYGDNVVPVTEDNFAVENCDLIISAKVVDNIEEAMEHIAKFGTKHSEAIVTRDYDNAKLFQKKVDAAVVYVNASTRFTDGFEFGFGAEIGISTQKLHARGPMGLTEMTSIKYIVDGDGQIR